MPYWRRLRKVVLIRIVIAVLAIATMAAIVAWALAPTIGVVVGVIAAVTVLPVLVRRRQET